MSDGDVREIAMKQPTNLTALAVVLPLCLSSCGIFGPADPGIAKLEDLVARVERVHVEVELARESAASAVRGLRTLVAADFAGDPVESWKRVLADGDASRDRAIALRETVMAMTIAAKPVFEQWRVQLDGIASASVRARSEQRLEETRARYDAIVVAVTPALDDYDALNRTLRDLSLFLSLDFNQASIRAIDGDLAALERSRTGLDSRLGAGLAAAREYLEATDLAGPGDPVATPQR